MKILLIEDEEHKQQAISKEVQRCVGGSLCLVVKKSLRGGLRAVTSGERFDLVLLDMSMPGFESMNAEPAFEEPEGFAGREILSQMKYRGIKFPVIVVTQYKAFASGTIGLEELVHALYEEFPDCFKGAIYYSTVVESWKKELFEALQRIDKYVDPDC